MPNRNLPLVVGAALGALMLIAGDVLILGNPVDPAAHPLFTEVYADQLAPELSLPLVSAPTDALVAARLLIAACVPLLCCGVWLTARTLRMAEGWYRTASFAALFAAVVLSPLLHSTLAFVGEVLKLVEHTEPSAHPALLETANTFIMVFYVGWGLAMLLFTVAWLNVAVMVFRGRTSLPRWSGITTPLFGMMIVIAIINVLPDGVSAPVSGAGLSIAYLLFFTLLGTVFRGRLAASAEPSPS
ncbi:MAG: DUF6796 family protein [Myxococcota bacterium]